MGNVRLDEAQAGIKIVRRNINNLRYADDTTLMAESKEELRSCLMKVKEESEKSALKLNIQKTKIMASGPITSWQVDGEPVETVTNLNSILIIPLLGIHTEETRSERDTCTPMFIAALFTIARKQPRWPSADEWIRKLWYIYTMEYYSAIKRIHLNQF